MFLEFNTRFSFCKKVQELEKEILDSKEKSEFYRSKMQELVSFFQNLLDISNFLEVKYLYSLYGSSFNSLKYTTEK